jgi:hypothetical protein
MTVIALGLLALGSFDRGSALVGLALLGAATIGVLLIAQGFARRGSVGLRIHASGSQASPLGFGKIGEEQRGLLRWFLLGPLGGLLTSMSGPRDAGDLLMALPAEHADQVIVELGALVADLQSKGSLAGMHWGLDSGQSGQPIG